MLNKNSLNLRNLKAVNEVIKRLNRLPRWTSMDNKNPYNELSKQALNSIIAYMLAIYAEKKGKLIIWERFPKVEIYRAFQKVYIYFDTKRETIETIFKLGNIPKSVIDRTTVEVIEKNTDKNFCDFICECLGTLEMDIYRAATKIATLVELQELSLTNNPEVSSKKFREIISSLEEFQNIPGVSEFSDTDGEYFQLFSEFSKLRNQNRWAGHMAPVYCAVLGHQFDAGIWAYLIGLEMFENEKIATQMAIILFFHDLPEVWTNDIPSPFKRMISGFRKALAIYEAKLLKSNLYDKVPEFMAESIQKVMIDDKVNENLFKYLKAADYLSADSECWRQYIMGSRDLYFFKSAMTDFDNDLKSGKYILPPTCKKLHDYFMKYGSICIKPFEELENED